MPALPRAARRLALHWSLTGLTALSLGLAPVAGAAPLPPLAARANVRPPEARLAAPEPTGRAAVSPAALHTVAITTTTKQDTLLVDVDGDTRVDPGDTVRYTIVIRNGGSTAAASLNVADTIDDNTTLLGAIRTTPLALSDAYTALGNVGIEVPAGNGLLANDFDADGSQVSLVSAPTTTTAGGAVTVDLNTGGFVYTPTAGFVGADTFTYVIEDPDGNQDTGAVTLTVSGRVWFINNTAPAGGDGRLGTPFNCLVGPGCFSAVAADAAGDTIFVYTGSGAYTAGLALLNTQRLIGQGSTVALATAAGLTVPPFSRALPATGGANPVLSTAVVTETVTLAQNNTVRGLTLTTGAITTTALAGVNFGTLTLADTTVNGAGRALNLENGALNAIFENLTATGSSTQGLRLNTTSGSLTVTGATALSNSTGVGLDLQANTASLSLGAVTIIKTASGAGVYLANNTGPLSFTTLTVTTSAGPALQAVNNSGALTVSGGALSATGGAALTLTNAAGNPAVNLTFSTLTASNSPTNGLVLDNIGGAGLTVTGATTLGMAAGSAIGLSLSDSTASALTFGGAVAVNNRRTTGLLIDNVGGTVTFAATTLLNPNSAGGYGLRVEDSSAAITFASATIQNTVQTTATADAGSDSFPDNDGDGDAIFISNTTGTFTLNGGTLSNLATDGVDARNAQAIALNNVTISGIGANSANPNTVDDAGVFVYNLRGSLEITNSTIASFHGAAAGGEERGVKLVNNNQNFTTLRLNNTDFTNDAGLGLRGDDAVLVTGYGAVSGSVVVENGSTFSGLSGEAVQVSAGNNAGSGGLTVEISNAVFQNAVNPGGFGGIEVAASGSAALDIDLRNNTLTSLHRANANSGHIALLPRGTGAFQAILDGNTITGPGAASRAGVYVATGDLAGELVSSFNLLINNNQINNTDDEAIRIDVRGLALTNGVPGNVRITNNLLGTTTAVGQGGWHGIEFRARNTVSTAAKTVHLLVEGNTIRNLDNSASDEALDIDAEDAATVNATVRNNQFNTVGAGATYQFSAATEAAASGMCLDLVNNTVTGGTATFDVRETAGTFAVENLANVAALNTGTVSYSPGIGSFTSSAGCPEPSLISAAPRRLIAAAPAPMAQAPSAVARPRLKPQTAHPAAAPAATVEPAAPVRPAAVLLPSLVVSSLPAGKTITVTLDVTVNAPFPAGATQVCNQAVISGANFATRLTDDPDTGAVDDATCTPIDVRADLTVTKTDDLTSLRVGQPITYTIVAANLGPQPASSALLTDTLPAALTGATWTCAAAGGAACLASGSGHLSTAITLPVGSAVTFTVAAVVSPAASGLLTNTVAIAAPAGVLDPVPGNNTATDTTLLLQPLNLGLAKTDADATGVPGGTLTYTLSYSNTGEVTATGVTLTETVPANTTYSGGGWTCAPSAAAGSTCTRAVGALAPGASGTASFAVTVDSALPSGVTAITNTAVIADDGANGPDAGLANNTAADTTPLTAAPDLQVSKAAGAAALPGQVLTYTLSYTNTGNQDATGVTLTETVPANTTYSGGGWTCAPSAAAGSTCTRAVGALAVGASGAASFVVVVDTPAPVGVAVITNTAAIGDDGANGADLTPADNTAAATTPLTAAPDLQVSKTAAAAVAPGGVLTYTLSYTNTGDQGATGVTLTETVPANTTYSGGGWTCAPSAAAGSTCARAVGPLAPGEASAVTFAVTVGSPVPVGVTVITNTVAIGDDGANGADLTPADNTAAATTALTLTADLALVKSAAIAAAAPLQPITFTLAYTNTGPEAALGVVITDLVPTGLVTATYQSDRAVTPTGALAWDVGTLLSGEGGVITVTAHVATGLGAGTPITNTAQIAAATTDPDPSDNASTAVVTVLNTGPTARPDTAATGPGAAVSIAVRANDTDLNGDPLTVTAVGGPGNGAAATDGLTVTYTPTVGFTGTDTFTYTVGDGQGGAATAAVTVTVQPGVFYAHLPLVVNRAAWAPDLVVGLSINGANAQVLITNQGLAPVPADAGFYVEMYVNPSPAPTQVNQTWNSLATQGAVWGISEAIPVGGVITLTINDSRYLADLSNLTLPLANGAAVYFQVDSANTATTYGGVLEAHEISGTAYNNIFGPWIVGLPADLAPPVSARARAVLDRGPLPRRD